MQSFGKPWLCVPQTPVGTCTNIVCIQINLCTQRWRRKKTLKGEPLCRSQASALQLLQCVITEIITEGTVLKEKENKHF